MKLNVTCFFWSFGLSAENFKQKWWQPYEKGKKFFNTGRLYSILSFRVKSLEKLQKKLNQLYIQKCSFNSGCRWHRFQLGWSCNLLIENNTICRPVAILPYHQIFVDMMDIAEIHLQVSQSFSLVGPLKRVPGSNLLIV